MQQTREQKIAWAAEDAERMTDGTLAREIVTQPDEHRRRRPESVIQPFEDEAA